jgi:hypothetical protein
VEFSVAIAPLRDELRTHCYRMLTVRGNPIAAITSFIGAEHFRAFGLPAVYSPDHRDPRLEYQPARLLR